MTRASADRLLVAGFAAAILAMPLWMQPLGAAYPDLLQRFAIYGIFAIGFNLLFGLTGYLSFGHAAFLGVGSYTAVWCFKLLTMNVLPALVLATACSALFAIAIGWLCLRRSGIYFSILTLAFAQMAYNLAYSVLTPITNGETGLQITRTDPRIVDTWLAGASTLIPSTNLFGLSMRGYAGFYVCALLLVAAFYVSLRIFRSPFGTMLRAIRSNHDRLGYTGVNARPYALAAFVISGAFAGLAGGLLAATDPLAGAERMQWTASGEVVLMTVLGGTGTLVGPVLGAVIIKYFENIFSAFNPGTLHEAFAVLPDAIEGPVVAILSLFVGDGWHLTLGVLFMLLVIFMPGGVVEGVKRLVAGLRASTRRQAPAPTVATRPLFAVVPVAARADDGDRSTPVAPVAVRRPAGARPRSCGSWTEDRAARPAAPWLIAARSAPRSGFGGRRAAAAGCPREFDSSEKRAAPTARQRPSS